MKQNGKCGQLRVKLPDLSLRVPGGTPALHGQFPWAVALMVKGKQFCGSSIIDENHLLTAAHCVYNMQPSQVASMEAIIGDNNIYVREPHEVRRKISKVYYHKGFSFTTLSNDVAVLKLDKPIEFGMYIQPVCLATSSVPVTRNKKEYATVAGWGKIYDKGPQSKTLRFADIEIWDNPRCQSEYQSAPVPVPNIQSSMVCAGSAPKDSCQGDSGGPLTYKKSGYYEQIGIVSWGLGCGERPGVYARVDHFHDWIQKQLHK